MMLGLVFRRSIVDIVPGCGITKFYLCLCIVLHFHSGFGSFACGFSSMIE